MFPSLHDCVEKHILKLVFSVSGVLSDRLTSPSLPDSMIVLELFLDRGARVNLVTTGGVH